MTGGIYRYAFSPAVAMEDVEASLVLALLAVQGLHGEAAAQLAARHAFNHTTRRCAIDATTPIGNDLNRLFVTFIRREWGEEAFDVQRIDTSRTPQVAA